MKATINVNKAAFLKRVIDDLKRNSQTSERQHTSIKLELETVKLNLESKDNLIKELNETIKNYRSLELQQL